MTTPSYQLIDSGNFQKLEQVGDFRFVRPSPQAVWSPKMGKKDWSKHDAKFVRYSGGEGKWEFVDKSVPSYWDISHGGLRLGIKRTDFGHLGFFAEQARNWHRIRELCQSPEPLRVLNLFAYTGGSSLAAAQGGAQVVHVDASKTSVAWARENAALNSLDKHPIRWIVDDVQKFVEKEQRRGRTYHGVILDPPSFGRGFKNEVWKIEEHLVGLMRNIKKILDDNYKFIMLSAHSHGYSPSALRNILIDICGQDAGDYELGEMLIEESNGGRSLPSGASCCFVRKL